MVFGDCQQALIDSSLGAIVGITPLNAVRLAGISKRRLRNHQFLRKSCRAAARYKAPEDWVFASPRSNGGKPHCGQLLMSRHIRRVVERVGIVKRVGWHQFAIPLSPNCNRAQFNRLLRYGLNLRPRIKDGKVFTPGPELIEVAVMVAIYITRLTRIIDAN